MELQAERERLVEQVKDLQDAAAQLVRALPGLVRGSSRLHVKQALMNHLRHTQQQWARLEQVVGKLGADRNRTKCGAVRGIIGEGAAALARESRDAGADAVILIAARRVTQYETASYRALLHSSIGDGCDGVTHLMELSLEETEAAEGQLGSLLRSVVGSSQVDATNGKGEPDAIVHVPAVDFGLRSHRDESGRGAGSGTGSSSVLRRAWSDDQGEPRPVDGGQVTAA